MASSCTSEEMFNDMMKKYKDVKFYPLPSFAPTSWFTDEEIIFSRAVARFQHLILM